MKRLLLVLLLLLALPSFAEAGWGRYYYRRPYAAYYGPVFGPPVVVARPVIMPYRLYRPVVVAPAYPVYGYPVYGYGW